MHTQYLSTWGGRKGTRGIPRQVEWRTRHPRQCRVFANLDDDKRAQPHDVFPAPLKRGHGRVKPQQLVWILRWSRPAKKETGKCLAVWCGREPFFQE